jgi:hypothetical protein
MVGPNVDSISIKGVKVVSRTWNKRNLYQEIEYVIHNYMSFPYRKNNPIFFIISNVDSISIKVCKSCIKRMKQKKSIKKLNM